MEASYLGLKAAVVICLIVQVPAADGAKEDEQNKDKKPLLSKSAVLRLLAELSRSYAGCAVLICQHTYQAGQSELIAEVSLLTACQKSLLMWKKTTNKHPFNGPLIWTTQVSRYQKGKTNLDFSEARVAVASAGPYASLHLAPDR